MTHLKLALTVVGLGLGLWGSLSPLGSSAAGSPIRVGVYHNPPKVLVTPADHPAGFWPELLAAIGEAEGWTLEYIPCEWENCLTLIDTGELDLMVDVSYSPERSSRFDFHQEVVVSSWSVVYVRAGDRLNSLLDLDGQRVGVLEDGVQYEYLTRQAAEFAIAPAFVEVADYDTMLRWLDNGTIDVAVMNKFTGGLAESRYPIAPTNVLVAPTQDYFVAPAGQNADLLAAIDEQLRLLKADPESVYYQLEAQWLEANPALSWQELWQRLLGPALVGVGLVAIAVLLWNRRLRRAIQQQQTAEQALKESEAWLQRVLVAAEIICWEENLTTGTIRYFGLRPAAQRPGQHGFTSAADFLQQSIHPEDRARVQAARAQAIATNGDLTIEHRLLLPDQQVWWVLTTGQAIGDRHGQPTHLVGSSLNITERKLAEQSLQISAEQLRLSLEVTNIGIWDWHTDSDQVEWSDNHFRLMGYEPGSITPDFQAWRQAVHPDDLDRIDQAINRALRSQTQYMEEYRIVHPDGTVRWVMGHGHTLTDDQGHTVRMLGVLLDITDRKEIEEALRESEAIKRQVLEALPDLLVWMKADGTCEEVAGGSNVIDLFEPAESVGVNQYVALPPDLATKRRQAIAAVLATGEIQVYEQAVEINGITQYEEVRVVPATTDRVLVIIRNISDRKQAEIALAESEQRYRIVTENMTDLVCLHAPDGRYLYVTPSCQALLGYGQAELVGKNPYEFFHPEDLDEIHRSHGTALLGDPPPVRYRFRHQDGHYLWLETLTKSILDETGQVVHLQTTSREVSDRVAMEQRLRHDAFHDALTQLPNRLLLQERLNLALKRARRHADFQFVVLFIDFDRFKVINDSLGHAIGDQLLTAIAQKFQSFIRDTDLVARLGGDEFVILLEEVESPNAAVQVAERILEDLRSPFLIGGQQIFISASIGIVVGKPEHANAETLIRNADIAMYRAKADGRASYAIFDPAMHAQVLQRMQLENDLRRALEQGEFTLFYQPIVALKSLQIVGFEALLRWQHPTQGLLTPDKFIPIVEETDLINPLGEWILLNACQQVSRWQQQYPAAQNLKLTVNLSVKQLREAILLPQLEKVLAATQIKPYSLTLEITESLFVADIDTTSRLLNQVQALGVKISIDDFGTGYSSLSYLHQLPVDSLKVDRSFVSPLETTAKNQTIAASIVGLSNLLALNAIAEGIETPEQLAWLQSLHCEYGQGYLFSRPVDATAAVQLLELESWSL
ncbi:MAG TPA: EAL domain-containing protein [Candidatus Obscuribacterales bacterium]